MAANDIRPFQSPDGGHAGPLAFPMGATDFSQGEVVTLTAAGALAEAVDDPASVVGIAAASSTDADGAVRATGTLLTVYSTHRDNLFVTRNFATAGTGAAVTPTQTNIGETAGFDLSGGIWAVDTGKANMLVEIVGIIDTNGVSITEPTVVNRDTDQVIFRFI